MSKQNVLIVSAKVDGFRRAGRAWSKEPTTVDAAAFDEKQQAALRADSMLTVVDSQVNVITDAEAQAIADADAQAKTKANGKAATKGAESQSKKAGK